MALKRYIKKSVYDYLTYSWWKYLALVIVCVMGVDLLFTMTAYRTPEDKKLEIYVLNGYVDAQRLQDELWPKLLEEYPEQEKMVVQNINILSNDMYSYMQFSTYVAAQQGDVCLMPVSEVEKLASEGAEYAFMELTPFIESGVIDPRGIDVTPGLFRSSEGVEGLYAIPADSLYGLYALNNDPKDAMLCILDYNGNEEPAAATLDLMIELYRTEKPEAGGQQDTSAQQTVLF